MSRKISLLLGIFLVFTPATDGAEPAPPPPVINPGVLLLRNGQVIEGQIEHNGDYYTVTLPDQELQIRAATVEYSCHDLREGYRQKKAAIQPHDIEQHLQLFLWCERHGLLDCAGDELTAAEVIDREHPMIPVLRRRLKVELQQKKEPHRPSENAPPPPSDEQLDRMTRGMPPGTVEAFVQVVQPILLNHCPGAVGYLLPGQKRLQLMRPPLGESPSRRVTQRNLYAVLECIDWDSPGDSPLLKASVGLECRGNRRKLSRQVLDAVPEAGPMGLSGRPEAGATGRNAGRWSRKRVIRRSGRRSTAPSGRALYRPTPRLPNIPGAKRGSGKAATESDGDSKAESGSNAESGGPAKPATAGHPSGSDHAMRKTPAEIAAPAIDAIDPYDPAAFNNQANAPTILPTPAARVLKGDK